MSCAGGIGLLKFLDRHGRLYVTGKN